MFHRAADRKAQHSRLDHRPVHPALRSPEDLRDMRIRELHDHYDWCDPLNHGGRHDRR